MTMSCQFGDVDAWVQGANRGIPTWPAPTAAGLDVTDKPA
jgi:hypothetical protein